jgi:hypothetical protein
MGLSVWRIPAALSRWAVTRTTSGTLFRSTDHMSYGETEIWGARKTVEYHWLSLMQVTAILSALDDACRLVRLDLAYRYCVGSPGSTQNSQSLSFTQHVTSSRKCTQQDRKSRYVCFCAYTLSLLVQSDLE